MRVAFSYVIFSEIGNNVDDYSTLKSILSLKSIKIYSS